ncbi:MULTISPECIES: DUF721 domain-containing protein [unclassified Legionella]|uniref:DUF721 domain-containing protein n=1 Tax=unclassified Legionella TaxID=2622702 RepID=UPI0010557117|nr:MULTISPECIES: DUF721 domain-containing protein [unclassified Legionella]MDI9819222.1 DUF721 domain-containing protein [Legionella sp. PL877]
MRPISHCLNNQLSKICQHTLQLDALDALLKSSLPPHLVGHCQTGGFSKGCLTISIDNASWATELRYLLPELRDKLRKEAGLYQLVSIKIAIKHADAPAKAKKQKKAATLSSAARVAIRAASEQCDDPTLKGALQQLARE